MATRPQMNLLQRLLRFNSLSNGQKIALMLALALSVVLLWGFWLASGAREYRSLYVSISDRDGGAVLAALESLGIPYRTGAEGVISVPEAHVHEARLRLAAQGLPKGNTSGFELLDSSRFGTSQFVEHVKYQRALEGELKRSIESVQAVKIARVHIALPRASAFLREQQAPSASVLLTLHPGRSLDAAHVAGIAHLVASSVPGLAASSVAVIDSTGALLDAPIVNAPDRAHAAQLAYARQLEQGIARRIEDLIVPLSGPGNVRAQVSADVDLASIGRAPIPTVTQSSTTNTVPVADVAETETQTDGAVSKKTLESDGALRRLAVAVLLNNRRSEGGNQSSRPWSSAELTQINALVREAMGFDASRGDTLSIVNSVFATANAASAAPLPWWKDPDVMELGRDVARYGTLLLLAIFLTFTLIRPLLRELARGPLGAVEAPRFGEPSRAEGAANEPALAQHRNPREVANVIKDWVRENE